MRLRPSTPEDLPAIQTIYAHWVRNGAASFEIEPPDLDELASRREAVLCKGLPYLVAQADDGQVAGYAYATLYRPREAYRFTVEDSIYLSPSYTGRGLGRLLLEAVIDECTRAGYRQMIAVIGGGLDNVASVMLHQACGFEHAGLLKAVGFKFGRWHDTALMQRTLFS